jgi:shikimate kinase
MGVGKTVAGRVLAERLRKKLVEVDSLIAQRAGKTIPQIFREDGEIVFRELEIAVIKEVSAKSNQVIDCGGGVVLNKINIDRLKQSAVVFWLLCFSRRDIPADEVRR